MVQVMVLQELLEPLGQQEQQVQQVLLALVLQLQLLGQVILPLLTLKLNRLL